MSAVSSSAGKVVLPSNSGKGPGYTKKSDRLPKARKVEIVREEEEEQEEDEEEVKEQEIEEPEDEPEEQELEQKGEDDGEEEEESHPVHYMTRLDVSRHGSAKRKAFESAEPFAPSDTQRVRIDPSVRDLFVQAAFAAQWAQSRAQDMKRPHESPSGPIVEEQHDSLVRYRAKSAPIVEEAKKRGVGSTEKKTRNYVREGDGYASERLQMPPPEYPPPPPPPTPAHATEKSKRSIAPTAAANGANATRRQQQAPQLTHYAWATRLRQVVQLLFCGCRKSVSSEVPDIEKFSLLDLTHYLVYGHEFRKNRKDAQYALMRVIVIAIFFFSVTYVVHGWTAPIWISYTYRWSIPHKQCGYFTEWNGKPLMVTPHGLYWDPKPHHKLERMIDTGVRLCHATQCNFEYFAKIEVSTVNMYTGKRVENTTMGPGDAKCLQKLLACNDIHSMSAKEATSKYGCTSVGGIQQPGFLTRLMEAVTSPFAGRGGSRRDEDEEDDEE